MTPEDKKLITVLTRLYAKTKADLVDWEPSEDASFFAVKFSDRPAERAGSDEDWDRAESALKGPLSHLKACTLS